MPGGAASAAVFITPRSADGAGTKVAAVPLSFSELGSPVVVATVAMFVNDVPPGVPAGM